MRAVSFRGKPGALTRKRFIFHGFFGLFLLQLELNTADIFRPEKGGATLMGGPSRQANLSIGRQGRGSLPGYIRLPQLTESQLSSRMMAPSVGTMLLLLIV